MAQRTTKSQVSGYRFLLRRLEHALVRRDVRMIHDPMSAHVKSLVVGLVLTLVVLGGAVAVSFFKPQGSVGDSKILMSKDSGQLYVLLNGQLRPALNLASARLVTGSAANPNSVKDSVLADYPRGPQVGIPGAPSSLIARGAPGVSEWTVCDRLTEPRDPDGSPSLAVVAGTPRYGTGTRQLGANDALFARNGESSYLIYRNTRAQIDPEDPVIRQALALQSISPRAASTSLLDALPPAPPIVAPVIDNAGDPSRFRLGGARVGSILRVSSLDAQAGNQEQLYVVLSDGIQAVSPFVADLIRASVASSGQPVTLEPNAIVAVPQVDTLKLDGYPDTTPVEVDGTALQTLCLGWRKDRDRPAALSVSLTPAVPVADQKSLIPSVGARSDGVTADLTYIPPGSGYFVRTTGSDPDSGAAASDFYVSDTGVRYGVPESSVQPLGMPDPLPAPYPVVKLIPPGPALARNAALISQSDIEPTAGS
ncbi:type VII secretion protein EccB [Williamsia sp. Leaf354]|uniref:type VII secretion protein EccB n=1 Tax=Williamsia sp. Leaf354 TaxID=1736349 RepID=UPI0009E8275F|nr:type VII secretion protein EccB [Williamsia sp. Leaf354]